MYFIKGVNGQIRLSKNRVVISRKGFLGFAGQGMAGDKEISIKSITAVQLKPATKWSNGFIQFTIMGGREFSGGITAATKDENSVIFGDSQNENIAELKRYINSVIDEEPIEFSTLDLQTEEQYQEQVKQQAEASATISAENAKSALTRSIEKQTAAPGEDVSPKSFWAAYFISVFGGWFGLDRFYLGLYGTGFLKLITVGGFGLWWLIDLIAIATSKMKDGKGRPVKRFRQPPPILEQLKST